MTSTFNLSINVLGIGSPCVDLLYQGVDDECLNALKLHKGDGHSVSLDRFREMRVYCENRQFSPRLEAGGSCANTIRGLGTLGINCTFYGKVGQDSAGDFVKKSFDLAKIKSLLAESPLETTQIAVFVTEDKQRTFMAGLGAGESLKVDDITPALFQNVQLVHLEGYLLEKFEVVEKIMQVAQRLGIIISLDAGCMKVIRENKLELLRIIKSYVNVLFCNQDECLQLTNLNAEKGCEYLSKLGPLVSVFNGKDGSWIGSDGVVFHSPTQKVEVVDTTGAGDLSASGFLYGLSKNWSLENCAWLANLIGSTAVTVPGAVLPLSLWDEIRQKIQERNLTL